MGAIVCGVDGSAGSRAALEVAARLAEPLGARLLLAHVVEYARVAYDGVAAMGAGVAVGARPALSRFDELERAGEALLERLADDAATENADRRVLHGVAAGALADLADEARADLIVVGSRGRGAFRAAFLGSVSTSLIGVARCPVVVVPPGATTG